VNHKRVLSIWTVIVPAFAVLAFAAPLWAQITSITIAAGSPEDQASQAIVNEADAQKRLAMWNDFTQKFASNPTAVAYGNLQLAQQYQASGDLPQALAAAEKAYNAAPNNLDILMTLASVAQQAKEYGKVVQYGCKGGTLVNSVGKQAKPEGMSDAEFATQNERARAGLQQQYDFLEAVAYNAIAAQENAKLRMSYIEQFTPAFPNSRFAEQIAQYAIISLQQMNDPARLAAFGQKALAANPDSIPTLILLANAFAEEQSPANLGKASDYARRAITLAKADEAGADKARILSAGVAHSALGYVLLKQDKTPAAIAELKQASTMLKDDPAAYSTVLFRLGYAYAKVSRLTEARATLTEAVGVPGPFQQASRDLLAKVNAARAKGK
jgi:tetratricopeptide (TPR) repeat protein